MTDKVIGLFGILLVSVFAFQWVFLDLEYRTEVRSILAQASSPTTAAPTNEFDSAPTHPPEGSETTHQSQPTGQAAPSTQTSAQTQVTPAASNQTSEIHQNQTNPQEPNPDDSEQTNNVVQASTSVSEGTQSLPRTIETEEERRRLQERRSIDEQRVLEERLRLERARLEQVHEAARKLNTAIRRTVNEVDTKIDSGLDRTLDGLQEDNREGIGIRSFDEGERRAAIDALKKKLGTRTGKLEEGVRESLLTNEETVELVLRSPLAEIELLLQNEVGSPVDLSTTAREVQDVARDSSSELTREHASLEKAGGLALYRDDDQDGVSNFDEETIYKTDPRNAYTGESVLTDGERILLGLNPLTNEGAQIPVESPLGVSERSLSALFEVNQISLAKTLALEEVGADTGTSTVRKEAVHLSGTAIPNSFVTLFIYSTPIVVTVKANSEGVWQYFLEAELENGDHELYVATVNGEGRIVAKSSPIPFVKTAEAIEFTPYTLANPTPDTDPIDILKDNLLIISVAALLVFAVFGIMVIGVIQRRYDHTPV